MDDNLFDLEDMEEEEIEAMAKRMGHTPQEEFKGDPEKYLDARGFVTRALTELPLAKSNLRTLNRRFSDMEARLTKKIEKQSKALEDFNSYHKRALQTTAEKEYQRGLEEARSRLAQAVEEGDVEGALKAHGDAEALLKNAPKEDKKPDTDAASEEEEKKRQAIEARDAWLKENTWFIEVPRMGKFAFECGEFLKNTQPQLTAAEQLAKVKEMVEEEFPNYFANPKRKKPNAVDTGHSRDAGSPKGGKRGYNDLPPEAQKMCDNMKEEIKGFTVEQYLEQYQGPWRN